MVLDRVNSGQRVGSASSAGVPFHDKRIQAGLSTQIVIQVTDDAASGQTFVIGAVQSLAVTENRDVAEVYEVGTDAIIALVPKSATTYTLELERIVFDFQRLPDALQREYRHIHAQRRPFDIVVTDYNPYLQNSSGPKTPDSGDEAAVPTTADPAINTTYGNCWFTRFNFTYRQNDYLITEACSMKCEFVKDDNAPHVLKGDNVDTLEREAGTSQQASIMSAFDAQLPG